MKKVLLFFGWMLLFASIANAQVPQGIPYQAVARNGQGQPLASTNVKVRFSILDSTATGAAVYVESHSTTTSALGLFSANVGMGTATTGTFSSINWGQNYKFLKVELDTTATGNSYIDLGTQQMMSVPYALYASYSSTTSSPSSNNNSSQDSVLNIVSGSILMPGSYVVPAGQYWKLVSLNSVSGFGSQTQTMNYSYCNCFPNNCPVPNFRCFYSALPIPVIQIKNDIFYAGILNGDQRLISISDCALCPPTYDFSISFNWDINTLKFPIWLEPNDQLKLYDNLRIVVEKYK